MTPHNEARREDVAEAALLPGDPQRAAWIAATFLEAPRLVNTIRGCLGYTGAFRGMPVTVQATGIGRPSFLIYAHELMAFYGVRRAIRVGTCGGLADGLALRDIVIADSARPDTQMDAGAGTHRPDARLLACAAACAREGGVPHGVGPVVSSDIFYHPLGRARFDSARANGAIACDMETSALYGLAAQFEARALSVCTVVDHMLTGEETALSERQGLFANMCRVALEALLADRRG
ncbi:MAG: DeoD-type purine-nucleoside phosphorylase [Rhizobiaceae bacterium]